MTNSIQVAVSDGTMTILDISIEYLDRSEITVYFDDVLTTQWEWVGVSEKRITFDGPPVLGGGPVPNGVQVKVKRTTDATGLRHEFSGGAKFNAQTLDEDLLQILHLSQEAFESAPSGDFFQGINMHGYGITDLADAVNPTDAMTLRQYQSDVDGTFAAAEAAAAAASVATVAAAAAEAAALTAPAAAAAAILWTDSGTGAGAIHPGAWFSGYVHPASYGNNIVVAHAAAASLGRHLLVPAGTFTINSNLDFTVPVVMQGGVLTGSGSVRFLAGITAAPYYWADINVALIQGDSGILPEWFGASSTGGTISGVASKLWNTWPSWVTGATFLGSPGHDYGNGAFLTANKPFTPSDSVDFIGLQRALWAGGVPATTVQGPSYVRLQGRQYKVNRQVTWTGQSAVGMRGAGQLSTTITGVNWITHALQGTPGMGNVKQLLRVYRGGPAPLDLEFFGLLGPTGYVPSGDGGPYTVALLELVNTNGVVPKHMWFSACEAAILGGTNSSDLRAAHCMFEFCKHGYYSNDGSWGRFDGCSWWQSWAYTSKVASCASAGIQIFGGQFIGYDGPLTVGAESYVQADWVDSIGVRRKVYGPSVERTFTVPNASTTTVVRVVLDPFSACRVRITVGGVVQSVGEYGGELTANVSRAAGVLTITTVTNTEWGNATAQAGVTLSAVDLGSGVFNVNVACTGILNGTAHVQVDGLPFKYIA